MSLVVVAAVPVTITITGMDEPPEFTSSSYSFTVSEDASAGTSLSGSVPIEATDPEGGSVSYSLLNGDGSTYTGALFNILSGESVIRVSSGAVLDFETMPTYALQVQATAAGSGVVAAVPVTITITGMDEPPEFTSSSYSFTLAEGASAATVLSGSVPISAVDPEGGSVSYSFVNTSGSPMTSPHFAIDSSSGVIRVKAGAFLNFEDVSSFSLRVQASDANASSSTAEVSISLTNVNEGPVFSFVEGESSFLFTVAEDAVAGTEVTGTFRIHAMDPEGGRVRYILLQANSLALYNGPFQIVDVDGHQQIRVRANAHLDADSNQHYSFIVQAEVTGRVLASTAEVFINVTDVDEPPVFARSSYEFGVIEGLTVSTVVTGAYLMHATDPEGSRVSYALLNADGIASYDGPFNLVEVGGYPRIRVDENAIIDAETTSSYMCKVQASAFGSDIVSTVDVLIVVIDHDEPPVFTRSNYSFVIAEDASPGDALTADFPVRAMDPEGKLVNCILLGNFSTMFNMVEVDGVQQIQVAADTQLDFETSFSYRFEVRASVLGSPAFSVADVKITILNRDEPPVFDLPEGRGSYDFTIAENSPATTVVDSVKSYDPEYQLISYHFVDHISGLAITDDNFQIDSSSGLITTRSSADLEYEGLDDRVFRFQVRAIAGIHAAVVRVNIEVTDVDEAPVFRFAEGTDVYTFKVPEHASAGTHAVGPIQLSAVDPEGGEVNYSLSDDSGAFRIVKMGYRQQIQVRLSDQLDFERMPSHTVEIQASVLGSSITSTTKAIIMLEDIDEPPIFYVDDSRNEEQRAAYVAKVRTDAAANDVVIDIYVGDAEDQALKLLLVQGNAREFSYEDSRFKLHEEVAGYHYQIRVKSATILNEQAVTLHLLLRELNDNDPTTQEYSSRMTLEVFIVNPKDLSPKFYSDLSYRIEQTTSYTGYVAIGAVANALATNIYVNDPESEDLSLILVDGPSSKLPTTQSEFKLVKVDNGHYQIRVKAPVLLDEKTVDLYLLLRQASDMGIESENIRRASAKIEITPTGRAAFFNVPKASDLPHVHSNPVSEHIKFVNLSSVDEYTYTLYTIEGHQLLSGSMYGKDTIDVGELGNGPYILALNGKDGEEVLRTRILVSK